MHTCLTTTLPLEMETSRWRKALGFHVWDRMSFFLRVCCKKRQYFSLAETLLFQSYTLLLRSRWRSRSGRFLEEMRKAKFNVMQISKRRQIVIRVKQANRCENSLKFFLSRHSTSCFKNDPNHAVALVQQPQFPSCREQNFTLRTHWQDHNPAGSTMQMQDGHKRPIISLAHRASTFEAWLVPAMALSFLLSHQGGGWGEKAVRFVPGSPELEPRMHSTGSSKISFSIIIRGHYKGQLIFHLRYTVASFRLSRNQDASVFFRKAFLPINIKNVYSSPLIHRRYNLRPSVGAWNHS